MKLALPLLTFALCASCFALAPRVHATTWNYSWPAAPDGKVPDVEISPFQWGKKWAYSVEIDDGPVSTFTVAQPLLAKFAFTDAPPGVAGGNAKPFVGGAAIFLARFDSGNATLLNAEQLQGLRQNGWGLLNHSYSHSGNSCRSYAVEIDGGSRRSRKFPLPPGEG